MSQYIECALWAGSFSDYTITIDEGAVDDTFTISASASLSEALADLAAQANASAVLAGSSYAFAVSTTGESVAFSGGATSFELIFASGSNFHTLCGFSSLTNGPATLHVADTTPTGVYPAACGYTVPWPLESSELREYRHGRSAAYIASNALGTEFWCNFASASDYEALREGPLLSGKTRVVHGPSPTGYTTAYSSAETRGYLDVFPAAEPEVRTWGRSEQGRYIRVRGTVAENGDPTVPTAGTFAELADSWAYGWGVMYALQVEGIPYLFTERDLSASDPSGYTQLPGSLIIDDSAKIGSIVDRKEGVGKGFDLTVGIMDSGPPNQSISTAQTVRSLFKAPSNWAKLEVDIADTETATITVDSTTGWASSGTLYAGVEAIGYTGTTATTFTTLTRGAPGGDWKAYDHDIASIMGTMLSDSPHVWRGREAILYAVPVDPFKNVPGANVLSKAVKIWRGNVADTPRRSGGRWVMHLMPLDRKLREKFSREITGQGRWTLEDDQTIKVDPYDALEFVLSSYDPTSFWQHEQPITIQPFSAYTEPTDISGAVARGLISSALTTALAAHSYAWTNGPTIGAAEFVQNPKVTQGKDGDFRDWELMVYATANGTPSFQTLMIRSQEMGFSSGWNKNLNGGAVYPAFEPTGVTLDDSDAYPVGTGIRWGAHPGVGRTLKVSIDEVDIAEIPSAGWLRIEYSGKKQLVQYSEVKKLTGVDSADVVFTLADTSFLDAWAVNSSALNGDLEEVSVTVLYRQTGLLRDMMRETLMSSGRGDNGTGTYDTLPLASGLDIAHVDEGSFDTVLDMWFRSLSATIALAEDLSFADVYGGWLALNQFAVCSRIADGDVTLGPVRTSMVDSGYYEAAVTDADLVSVDGATRPVRILENAHPRPNSIKLECQFDAEVEDGTITVNDLQAMRAEGARKWEWTIYGKRRGEVLDLAFSGAVALFSGGLGKLQVIEVDVHPAVDVTVGGRVKFDLTSDNLWQYSTGLPGYAGFGRVIGDQIDLSNGVKRLTCLIDGALSPFSWAPSAPYLARDTSDPAGWVEVSLDYYDLFKQWHDDGGNFDVVAYLPGSDTANTNRWTISAVTDTGSRCRLTVSAESTPYFSSSVTTAWYITVAQTSVATTPQTYHAHVDTDGYWIG